MLIAPWHVIVATVAVSAVAVSGVGAVGVQEFQSAQQTALSTYHNAMDAGKTQIGEVQERISNLELAIQNAEGVLSASEGKTLDEAQRSELSICVEQAKSVLTSRKNDLSQLRKALRELSALDTQGLFWPESVVQSSSDVLVISKTNSANLMHHINAIGAGIREVQTAVNSWQTEQDRIAKAEAEAEAQQATQRRMSQPRAIPADSQLGDEGGTTAPSAPITPRSISALSAVLAYNVENYVSALAPNARVEWVSDYCLGYFACGTASWRNNNPAVVITLDANLRYIYENTAGGLSVVTHEIAHARQWLTYGAGSTEAFKAYYFQVAGIDPPTMQTIQNNIGEPDPEIVAVEYMADCATLAKIGYSTGAYTSSCTSSQMATAASIW